MPFALGIDIGGTKIEGVLINQAGKVFKKLRLPTEADKSRNVTLNNILTIVDFLKTDKVEGLGVACPGFVVDGKLTLISNIPSFNNFDLGKALMKNTDFTNIVIENDAVCFTHAEQRFGAAKKIKNVVGVILGTGVGGGIIINGQIYRGAIGGAGHLGHHIIDYSGETGIATKNSNICRCGNRGDLESLCSGKSIVRRYKKAGGKLPSPNPQLIFTSKEKIARYITKETIEYLGIGLANIVNILNPEVIVLGGGLSNLNFYVDLRKVTKKYSNSHLFKSVKIVKNQLGDASGFIGAGALTFE